MRWITKYGGLQRGSVGGGISVDQMDRLRTIIRDGLKVAYDLGFFERTPEQEEQWRRLHDPLVEELSVWADRLFEVGQLFSESLIRKILEIGLAYGQDLIVDDRGFIWYQTMEMPRDCVGEVFDPLLADSKRPAARWASWYPPLDPDLSLLQRRLDFPAHVPPEAFRLERFKSVDDPGDPNPDLHGVIRAQMLAETALMEFVDMGDDLFDALGSARHLNALTDLHILHRQGPYQADQLRRLARGPLADQLRFLDLFSLRAEEQRDEDPPINQGEMTEAAINELLRPGRFPRLIGFGLRWIGASGPTLVRRLAQVEHLHALEDLMIAAVALTPDDLDQLTRAPFFEQLDWLQLSSCAIDDDGAALLAKSPRLARLKTLNLHNNRIGDRGLRALLASPHRSSWRELKLAKNQISPELVDELRRSGDHGPITDLDSYPPPSIS